MSLEKMHPELKEQFCEKVYENCIVEASVILLSYEEYAKKINAKLPASCYTNFRDALFHFRKVVSSVEESEIEKQAFAVKEHLSRSLTDAGSSIMYHLSSVAEELLTDDNISVELRNKIRKSIHNTKKANLRKRFSGMMISDDNISNISHVEIQDIIDSFYCLIDENCSEEFANVTYRFCQYDEE